MASKDEADVVQSKFSSSEKETVNGKKSSPCSSQLSCNIESYIKSFADEISKCDNPRLKSEQKKLLDLLSSYNKLCSTLRKEETVSKPKEPKIPEIYRLLHPELYKDIREEEKNKLRYRFARKRVDRNDPKFAINHKSPLVQVNDTRQKEKERFIKLISSAPSVLLNTPTLNQQPCRRLADPKPKIVSDREREKDRLTRIFSSDLESNPTFKKKSTVVRPARKSAPAAPTKLTTKPTPPNNNAKVGMVRKSMNDVDAVPRRLAGSGDKSNDRRKKLLELKTKEYQEYVSQARQTGGGNRMDKGILAREASILQQSASDSPRSVTSVSTQTDSEMSPGPSIPAAPVSTSSNVFTVEAEISPTKMFPVHKEPFITSPRAKLIKDLHCVSPCLPGVSPLLTLPEEGASDEKIKQMMYADALKAQIDEKRRIEEERKRKELEEEELIERKAKEQQERLKMEYEREQTLRQDWLMQRQQQEDSLRQRLVEMELEAKEFKKRERRKKTDLGDLESEVKRLELGDTHLSPRVVQELIPRAMQEPETQMSSSRVSTPRQRPRQNGTTNGETHQTPSAETLSKDEACNGTARSPSPVLPALQTDNLLKKSHYSSPRLNFKQANDREELIRGDKILTQLGLFRKELELEQERLQQRLQQQQS